jgi:hypothetical protein
LDSDQLSNAQLHAKLHCYFDFHSHIDFQQHSHLHPKLDTDVQP